MVIVLGAVVERAMVPAVINVLDNVVEAVVELVLDNAGNLAREVVPLFVLRNALADAQKVARGGVCKVVRINVKEIAYGLVLENVEKVAVECATGVVPLGVLRFVLVVQLGYKSYGLGIRKSENYNIHRH